ncbi:hypothetical protein N7510_001192 [Penicillium lagena]|uniref:uncharacterized protein n=1 Tax=Penicillium lagena TaxID=94218 RepID=UPI002541450F|nr:uncharacterized protein N7510_001192 [Penicillium lagena]KAJ5624883.1 hypothetical protein N7510_001192 [Penicillium lagena]
MGRAEIVRILLDAHADVNTQGDPYGSSLVAAVHEGHFDQVQILLNTGADSLLADELDQTPLHTAASRNMLHILYRFRRFTSTINDQDKLLQTPLHLAVCLGHIRFAIMLLNLGSDPCLQDGYGRNIMDWALRHELLMHQIRKHCPQTVLTPDQILEQGVR